MKYFRFVVVGIVVNLFELAVYFFLCTAFQGMYILSNIIAGTLALTMSYMLNNFWTFQKHQVCMKCALLLLLVHLANLALCSVLLYFAVEILDFHYLIGKMLVTGVSSIWGYFISKNFIYK